MTDRAAAGVTCVIATPRTPGAIGIFQLRGAVLGVLRALTGCSSWPVGRLRHVEFEDIDDGLAGRIDEHSAQLMPHGGPRVGQRIAERLHALGAEIVDAGDIDPREVYPEARDDVEALILAALARARSPLAIDTLLDQPARWRTRPVLDAEDHRRAARLSRLIEPPTVVLAGPPNVGKSTLSNALFGCALSITEDRPGTTRDYTRGWLDLAGLVVAWHDTPGLGAGEDPIDRRAADLARALMECADLLIAVTDAGHPWPDLPRQAHLRVASRSDLGRRDDADVSVCAPRGEGLPELVRRVRDTLVPADLTHPGPWRFDDRL